MPTPMRFLLLVLALHPGCRGPRTGEPMPAEMRQQIAVRTAGVQAEASLREAMLDRAHRLDAALRALEAGDLETARAGVQDVLQQEPDNVKATELDAAVHAARNGARASATARRQQTLRTWMDDFLATRDETLQMLKWPSRSFWHEVTAVRSRTGKSR